jgi:SAM-dependent methyltransferase
MLQKLRFSGETVTEVEFTRSPSVAHTRRIERKPRQEASHEYISTMAVRRERTRELRAPLGSKHLRSLGARSHRGRCAAAGSARAGYCLRDGHCGTNRGPNSRRCWCRRAGPQCSHARGARSAAEAEGVSAEWREGSAVELPLADATFDVAFCQQGLQFFPDRPAALREMYRILVPSGRVVLSVWRGIERSPGFAVLADA